MLCLVALSSFEGLLFSAHGGNTSDVDRSLHDNKDCLTVFTADRVKQQLGLSHGGLILFALMCGGDYDLVSLSHPPSEIVIIRWVGGHPELRRRHGTRHG